MTKALPVHKQEATDAEGMATLPRRLHRDFSAGYFNTVGSKEGWTPQQFTSSRANRAKVTQTAEDFMDDDEREEMRATALEAQDDYDTFGTAAELRGRSARWPRARRRRAAPRPAFTDGDLLGRCRHLVRRRRGPRWAPSGTA